MAGPEERLLGPGGLGVLHGSATVTEDACLYGEALAFAEAERRAAGADELLQQYPPSAAAPSPPLTRTQCINATISGSRGPAPRPDLLFSMVQTHLGW